MRLFFPAMRYAGRIPDWLLYGGHLRNRQRAWCLRRALDVVARDRPVLACFDPYWPSLKNIVAFLHPRHVPDVLGGTRAARGD